MCLCLSVYMLMHACMALEDACVSVSVWKCRFRGVKPLACDMHA